MLSLWTRGLVIPASKRGVQKPVEQAKNRIAMLLGSSLAKKYILLKRIIHLFEEIVFNIYLERHSFIEFHD